MENDAFSWTVGVSKSVTATMRQGRRRRLRTRPEEGRTSLDLARRDGQTGRRGWI